MLTHRAARLFTKSSLPCKHVRKNDVDYSHEESHNPPILFIDLSHRLSQVSNVLFPGFFNASALDTHTPTGVFSH